MKHEMKARLAENHEGQIVRDLMLQQYSDKWGELDWSTIKPYWIAGELDGEVKACVQIVVGKPIGMLEFLCLDDSLSRGQKAMLIKEMHKFAMAGLYGAGSSAVVGHIPYELKSWKKILKRRWGGKMLTGGNLFMKRFA